MRINILIPLFAVLLLSACAGAPKGGGERLYLAPATFEKLEGWGADNAEEALPALEKSCARIAKKDPAADFGAGGVAGKAADWQGACAALAGVADAKGYFESHFTPHAVYGGAGPEGLFTGYYQPLLNGSHEKKAPYLTPLYARPASMVTADLGAFSEDLKGKTVTGMVAEGPQGARLIPFFDRAAIEGGALEGAEKIVWVDDPVDAFFLHIQGSGLVRMEDGTMLSVGYAAQNGRPYTAIGRELIKRGALTKENVSMQSIRAWLEAHPDDAPGIMNVNASYVFFKALDGSGAIGAEGVELTPGRSMAVDRRLVPYGAPLWLDAEHPDGGRLRRLMVAQDTGGAITGAVRGDFFWGPGDEAADKAGRMKSRGVYYILLPKTVKVPPSARWHFWRGLFAPAGRAAERPSYND